MIKFSSVVAFLLANLLLDVVQCLDFNNSQKDAHLLHAAKEHLAVAKNSLQKSTWPADHGDVSRSKYTIGAGLPQYFDPADIQIHTQPRIPSAQWFYTYGNNSEILYTMSGPMSGLTLSKLNSQTLEILQQVALKPSIYMGGLLMHENGHVYCIHSNILYRFWNGDLENVTSMTIPTELNLGLVQTNGMLVTTDGYLVTKQWSMNIEDLLYLRAASKPSTLNQLLKLVIALSIVLATIDYFRAKTFTTGRLVKIIITAALLGLTILVVPVSIALQKRLGDFRVADYLTNNVLWLNGGGGGEIKIIDPLTFEVIQDFKLAERCSYPRLAMTKVKNELSGETEDAIVVVGDENVYQLRWNIAAKQLYMLPQWTRRYRHRWAGSFPGTGPAIYDDTAYFTDNTFCGFLFGRSFNLYNRSILVTDASLMPRALSGQHPLTTLAAGPGHYPDIKGIPLTQEAPGFLFFSVVVSPIERDIIVWDAASRSVQARSLNSLALHWEAKLLNMDCLMVAADKGHIYVSDYSDGPMEVNDFAREANSQPDSDAQFKHLSKFFIVLNATTGAVIANVTIADEQQLTAMMIIAGANNDVFMGSTKGLIRISINTTQPQ